MADPALPLQSALLAALNTALSCSVYDAVPQGAAYPYVTMDYSVSVNDDLLGGYRKDERYYYLTVWSRAYGSAEVYSIMASIDSLNETPLTLSSGDMVSLRVERKRTSREPDNLTFMGQVTLRIITTHSTL